MRHPLRSFRWHNAVWVPDRRSLALTCPGRRDVNFRFNCQTAEDMHPHSRDTMRPGLASVSPALAEQRAQGKPGARCTRGLVCNLHKKMRTRAYRFSGGIPAFPARWFTAYSALSLVTGLSCHHHRRDTSRQLDASVGASGPHGFAVRLARARLSRTRRPPHLIATFVTIASRPSFG